LCLSITYITSSYPTVQTYNNKQVGEHCENVNLSLRLVLKIELKRQGLVSLHQKRRIHSENEAKNCAKLNIEEVKLRKKFVQKAVLCVDEV